MEIKDWQERTWRHLDTCEFETVITARVPRILLQSGRTLMVSVPWAEAGGRFTKSFERHVIELLTQRRTVRGAARLARLTEDAVDGVLRRAVFPAARSSSLGALGWPKLKWEWRSNACHGAWPKKDIVEKELRQWSAYRNAAHATTDWQFTTNDARIKLKRLYPSSMTV